MELTTNVIEQCFYDNGTLYKNTVISDNPVNVLSSELADGTHKDYRHQYNGEDLFTFVSVVEVNGTERIKVYRSLEPYYSNITGRSDHVLEDDITDFNFPVPDVLVAYGRLDNGEINDLYFSTDDYDTVKRVCDSYNIKYPLNEEMESDFRSNVENWVWARVKDTPYYCFSVKFDESKTPLFCKVYKPNVPR